MLRHLVTLACFFIPIIGHLMAQDFEGGFSFYLPSDDGSSQRFLPEFPANPIRDFITIDGDGHFTDAGTPIRFWGVNLTTGSCFPAQREKSRYRCPDAENGHQLGTFSPYGQWLDQ